MVYFSCRYTGDHIILQTFFSLKMACILCPEFNFMNGYFRCLLPYKTLDVEVKVVTMRGVHTFRRDRTTKIIQCNPWSARFHPYSTLIKKMRTYLHLEGKLCPKHRPQTQVQPSTSTPAQPIVIQLKERRKTRIQLREGIRWGWLPNLCTLP